MNLASLPGDCSWKALNAVAWLGGIGFTMSLFVSNLAFPGHEELINSAKLGIFAASILAALVGWMLIRRLAPAADAVP